MNVVSIKEKIQLKLPISFQISIALLVIILIFLVIGVVFAHGGGSSNDNLCAWGCAVCHCA